MSAQCKKMSKPENCFLSVLLRAKTLRAFKEMVTNDYHLLVQLPYPTHYYFKTTLFAQKQCYSQ